MPVFFEVGRLSTKGGHAHVQSVPIPMKLKDDVEKAFLHEGRMQGIDFEGEPDAALEACAGGRGKRGPPKESGRESDLSVFLLIVD